MTSRDLDKLVVALMIITILTIISVGVAVTRYVNSLEKHDKVEQCLS